MVEYLPIPKWKGEELEGEVEHLHTKKEEEKKGFYFGLVLRLPSLVFLSPFGVGCCLLTEGQCSLLDVTSEMFVSGCAYACRRPGGREREGG